MQQKDVACSWILGQARWMKDMVGVDLGWIEENGCDWQVAMNSTEEKSGLRRKKPYWRSCPAPNIVD